MRKDHSVAFKPDESVQEDPIKVFWGSNTIKGREALSPIKKLKENEPLQKTLPPREPTGGV